MADNILRTIVLRLNFDGRLVWDGSGEPVQDIGEITQFSAGIWRIAIINTYLTDFAPTGTVKRNDGTGDTGDFIFTLVSPNRWQADLGGWLTQYPGTARISIHWVNQHDLTQVLTSPVLLLNVLPAVRPAGQVPEIGPNQFDAIRAYVDSFVVNKADKSYSISWGSLSSNSLDLGVSSATGKIKVAYNPLSARSALVSGEDLQTIVSKIDKYFKDLKPVSFSASYADLINTPALKAVATSGSYLDLTNKPTAGTGLSYSNNSFTLKPATTTTIGGIIVGSGLLVSNGTVSIAHPYSQAEHDKLAGIQAGAQANVLEGVKVNGQELPITNKKVDVSVPTTTSQLLNNSNYVNTGQLANFIIGATFHYADTSGVLSIEFTRQDNSTFTANIDLPLEFAIDSHNTHYVASTHTLTIAFVGGGHIDIPVGDLVDLYYADEQTLNLYLDSDSKYKFRIKPDWISANIATKLDKTGNGKDVLVSFARSNERTAIATDETLSVLFGKVSKWLADLQPSAFNSTDTLVSSGSNHLITSGAVFTALQPKADKSELSAVATSGSYNDLLNRPTSLKNPYPLKFGAKSYDGSAEKTLTLADLTVVESSPISGSSNPISAGGVYSALQDKQSLSERITTIRESASATDDAYPTEKAVRTLFDTGLIYQSDFIASQYPSDAEMTDNPDFYKRRVLSVYATMLYLQDHLSNLGVGDMLSSVYAPLALSQSKAGYVDKALSADVATSAHNAEDSVKFAGQLPTYYLNYSNLSNKPNIPTVPSALPSPESLSITIGNDTITYNGSVAKSITYVPPTIPTKLPSPSSLSITIDGNTTTYDGSSAKSITYTSPTIPTALKSPFSLSLDIDGQSVIYDGSSAKSLTYTAPTALPNPHSLHIGNITYNGSSDQTVTAASLGLSSVYTYKGSVNAFGNLPTGASVGDTYNVATANGSIPAGTNYAWDGSGWDALGGSVDLSNYLTKNGNGKDVTVSFTTATSRQNILTDETLSIMFGKVSKWLVDLHPSAFNTTDTAVASGSNHLITSGAVYTALQAKADASALSTVATSGSYSDLSNRPTFKTVNGQEIVGTGNIDAGSNYTAGQNIQIAGNVITNTNPTIKRFNNVSVPATAWVADETYEGFAYKASVPLAGVDANYAVDVHFDPDDCLSGNYASFTVSYAGGVCLYASSTPTSDITIGCIATKME